MYIFKIVIGDTKKKKCSAVVNLRAQRAKSV